MLYDINMQIINIHNYNIYINEKTDDPNLFPNDFFKCQQTHSSNIYLRESWDFVNQQADWIICNILNTKIAVRVADCNAIILMWKKYFGIVHAWWRWLKDWILTKAIKIMQQKWEKDIQIYVWPSIRQCCYEVGNEFKVFFDNKYLISTKGRLYLDMISIIQDTAQKNWISQITIHPDCTYCSSKYFSYRRWDKDKRMIISLEKIF